MPPKKSPVPARVASVSDQLAAMVRSCGKTPAELAQDAGIAPSVLSRFLRGERGLTSESIDKLAEALGGVHLVRAKKSRGAGDRAAGG